MTSVTLPPKSERCFRRHKDSLLKLSKPHKKGRRNEYLKQGKRGLVRCICECAYNIIKGGVPLSDHHLNRLKRKKKGVRYLANRQIPIRDKEKYLNQEGGGLIPLILGPVLKVLSGIFTK